jgi:integrase/recombinase XerD
MHQWPSVDRLLWEQATDDADPFSDAAGAKLADTTKTKYLFAWRRFLGFLSIDDPLTLTLAPVERLTRDRVRSFADHLAKTNIPRSVAIQVDALYQAARIMMPNVDLAWLKSIKARLHAAAPLRHASGPVVTSLQLLDLGLLLMTRADPRPECRLTINGASCYRDGLMIAMLAFMPLRRKNLAALEIGRHIIEEGNSRLIVIPAAETKTRTLIEFVIPELLLPYLAVYLKIVRPRLRRDPDCKALWTSPRGGALGSNAIWKLICRHTSAELGVRLTPHDVRDAAATTWALEAPSQIAVSRDLLSHSDLRTTQKHYNRARGVVASRSYSELLGRIKRSAKRN